MNHIPTLKRYTLWINFNNDEINGIYWTLSFIDESGMEFVFYYCTPKGTIKLVKPDFMNKSDGKTLSD